MQPMETEDMQDLRKLFRIICSIALGATVFVASAETSTLQAAYKEFFPIGAAIATEKNGFDSLTRYPPELLAEFSSLVAENCMKPGEIEPAEGKFAWTNPDRIVAYAKEHGMLMRGHTLVWHNQSAQWMFSATGSADEKRAKTRDRLKTYIGAVVGRYRNDVYCWDVVNEAVKDDWDAGKWPSIYRENSPWFAAYGNASYIQDAFDFAREASPDAKLFYNDYGLCGASKRARTIEMIKTLKLKDHGLTGVGIQGHWNLSWPPVSEIQVTIDAFAALGLEVQITELDIDCYGNTPSEKGIPYAQVEDALAKRYAEIFACFRKNSGKITGVTFWGVADDHTWLDHFWLGVWHEGRTRKNWPLLFAEDGSKKKAYRAVVDFKENR